MYKYVGIYADIEPPQHYQPNRIDDCIQYWYVVQNCDLYIRADGKWHRMATPSGWRYMDGIIGEINRAGRVYREIRGME
jgi:hypothetical protein